MTTPGRATTTSKYWLIPWENQGIIDIRSYASYTKRGSS